MRLNAITDAILEEAVRAQQSDEFDTHDVIFWIMQNHPRPYARDLHSALEDEGGPFERLHTAIGIRLAGLGETLEQQHRKRRSQNVRGEISECEVWRRVAEPSVDRDMSQELRALRQALIIAARGRQFVSYTEAVAILGMEGTRPWRSPKFFEALDAISTFEYRNGRPLLSAVVVHGTDKKPGGGFFKMAKSNGVQERDEKNGTFFRAELGRVHDYWAGGGTQTGGRP